MAKKIGKKIVKKLPYLPSIEAGTLVRVLRDMTRLTSHQPDTNSLLCQRRAIHVLVWKMCDMLIVYSNCNIRTYKHLCFNACKYGNVYSKSPKSQTTKLLFNS